MTDTFTSAEAASMLGIAEKSINRLVRAIKLRPCEGTTLPTWRFTEEAIAKRIAERAEANKRKAPPARGLRHEPIFWTGE